MRASTRELSASGRGASQGCSLSPLEEVPIGSGSVLVIWMRLSPTLHRKPKTVLTRMALPLAAIDVTSSRRRPARRGLVREGWSAAGATWDDVSPPAVPLD